MNESQTPKSGIARGNSPLPDFVNKLAAFFVSRNIEAYLVGGVVRDTLLGRTTEDIDVAVDGDPVALGAELASFIGGHLVPLDQQRGIVRVTVPDDPGVSFVDINGYSNGLHADLARRDFTINAMALPIGQVASQPMWDRVVDPYNGRSDLREGILRSLGPSVFVDDPARLVRAPRLAAQLRFEIAQDTMEQIRRNSHLVELVAPERIRVELMKLLAEHGARDWVRMLDSLGLLGRLIPGLDETRGVTQPREHHWDVFNHLVETVGHVERIVGRERVLEDPAAAAVPAFESMDEHFTEHVTDGHSRLTLLKLAGLLHDIAKPATRTVEDSGRIRFLGHHELGAEVAVDVLSRLRFGGRGVELVRMMVLHHLRPGQMATAGELPSGKAIYRYFRDVGDAAIDTVYLNMADYLAARGPQLETENWNRHCQVVGHILREGLERKAPTSLPKLINGHNIMEFFSLQPGPQIGTLMNLVRESQANGEINTKEEALELVKVHVDLGDGGA